MIRNSAKAVLRARIKNTLKEMSTENKQLQSKVILQKVLESPSFEAATRVSVYLSTDTEVDTLPILQEMFRRKKQVFVPTYEGQSMEMVRLHSMDDYESLPLTKWHIKQPACNEGRENALDKGGLDLILVPGVAFTRQGGRCGHGMGYYDKFLHRLFATGCTRDKVSLVGLCFKEQLVESLPLDEHDVLLDQVITGE